MTSDALPNYDVDGLFDEAILPDGTAREHYEQVLKRIAALSPDEMSRRARLRDEIFRTQGITFTVYSEEESVERLFPMDLVPRVIPEDEWADLEVGLKQRVRALNHFLEDLYDGERSAINDGIVPPELVLTGDVFAREAAGVHVPHAARCLVAGVDLIRDADGTYRVLEDNLRNPSGISYVLENRSVMTRVMPLAFTEHQVRPVDHYANLLLTALREVAPPAAGDPTVAVLTPGVFNSAYYEHAFLARQMGVELVEGRDLVVDEHVLYMRTTRGLKRIDVIYRRIDDEFLDPVVFRPDSQLGVPGLMAAARAGNVTLANAVGNGVADNKAVYAYVPEMIRYYLDEEPALASVETYLLWDPDHLKLVLDRLDQLVVKEVDGSGGYGMLIGPKASDEEIAEFRKRIEANPHGYIAQETISLSTHPTIIDDHLEPRHVDLRPFVICGEKIEVIPGGLTRVALRKGSLVVNSSQGGGSKDTWVLGADPAFAEAPATTGETGEIDAFTSR